MKDWFLISGYCVFYNNILLDFLGIKYEVRIEKLLKLDFWLGFYKKNGVYEYTGRS